MNYLKMQTTIGDEICRTINSAIAQAIAVRGVEFEFNGVTVRVMPDSNPDLIYRDWRRSLMRDESFIVWPYPADELTAAQLTEDAAAQRAIDERMARRNAEYEAKEKAKRAKLEAELKDAPEFAVSDQEARDTWNNANQDDYGQGVIRYAELWARLMQSRMAAGVALAECADAASHDADIEGITGFMFGAACSYLRDTWQHGAELIEWRRVSRA